MNSTKPKRATKALKLLLVSSAVILNGCRAKKDLPPPPAPAQDAAAKEKEEDQQAPTTPTQHSAPISRWGFIPFFSRFGSQPNSISRSPGLHEPNSLVSTRNLAPRPTFGSPAIPRGGFGGHSSSISS